MGASFEESETKQNTQVLCFHPKKNSMSLQYQCIFIHDSDMIKHHLIKSVTCNLRPI